MELIKISEVFPVSAKVLYESWLNSEAHTKFTGAKANMSTKSGMEYSAGDGYIHGRNISLQPFGRIVQTWRASDFPDSAPDSQIEVLFEGTNGGTRLTLIHTYIPKNQKEIYEKGWKEHYFKPMKKYFSKK